MELAVAHQRGRLSSRPVQDQGNNMARLLSVNVGRPRDIEWQGRTVHTGIWKEPVRGPFARRAAERRRRRTGRPGRPRRGAARGLRLPARVVPLLGGASWAGRLRLRTVRRELHRRGLARRRGLHRRSLPDRQRAVRGHAAAGHLLPRRHPDERAADAGAARRPAAGQGSTFACWRRERSVPVTRS